jgi:site-specific recombinase XerD
MPQRRAEGSRDLPRGMFIKPGSPDIWISYTDGFGKYRREKCGSYTNADIRLKIVRAKALKDKLIPAEFRPSDVNRPTIADIVEVGLVYSKRNKPKSYKFDVIYSKIIIKLFGERIADEITGRELESGLERHAQVEKWAGATFNRHKSFLAMCYKQASYSDKPEQRVETNPAKMIRGKRETKVDRYLSRGDDGEYAKLLAAITEHYPQHLQRFNFALATGLRWSSQHMATYAMLNEQTCTLSLPTSKTGKPLHLSMNPHAMEAIRLSASYGQKTGFIFPNGSGKQMRQCGKWFRDVIKVAGITTKPLPTWHSATRHSFCSWLVQDGVPLHRVGKLAGHSDMHTTDRYAHYAPENMAEDSARFNPLKGVTVTTVVTLMSPDEEFETQTVKTKAATA